MPADSDLVVFRRMPAGLSRPDIRAFAVRLREEVAGGRPFCCLITSDAELRRLNRDFTGGDYATDVLSFPAESASAGGSLGDVAISSGRARAQALEHGHCVEREIEILMLHGLLHLLGMDHASDRGRMARAERKWRTRLGLPEGLIERARE